MPFTRGWPWSLVIALCPQSATQRVGVGRLTTVPSTVERLLERHAYAAVVGVHQHVRAGLNLGHAVNAAADVVGPGAARRDDLARKPGRANPMRGGHEVLHGVSRSRLAFLPVCAAAAGALRSPSLRGAADHALPPRAAPAQPPRPLAPRRTGPDPRSHRPTRRPVTAAAFAAAAKRIRPCRRIDGDRDRDSLRQRGHASALLRPHDLVGYQHIVTKISDGLGFRHRRAGDPDARSARQLSSRDLRRLMGLEVRSKSAGAAGRRTPPCGRCFARGPRRRRSAPA